MQDNIDPDVGGGTVRVDGNQPEVAVPTTIGYFKVGARRCKIPAHNIVRKTFVVWKHFINSGVLNKNGNSALTCMHCQKVYIYCPQKIGASTLLQHIKSCSKNPESKYACVGKEPAFNSMKFDREQFEDAIDKICQNQSDRICLATQTLLNVYFIDYVRSYAHSTFDEVSTKFEFEVYLREITEDQTGNFNILSWWKNNANRFPILSKMGDDILAIPISNIPSKSAFCTGGGVLDDFISSLTPSIIECLVCTQRWMKKENLKLCNESKQG